MFFNSSKKWVELSAIYELEFSPSLAPFQLVCYNAKWLLGQHCLQWSLGLRSSSIEIYESWISSSFITFGLNLSDCWNLSHGHPYYSRILKEWTGDKFTERGNRWKEFWLTQLTNNCPNFTLITNNRSKKSVVTRILKQFLIIRRLKIVADGKIGNIFVLLIQPLLKTVIYLSHLILRS